MNYRLLATINAVLLAVVGLIFLIVPVLVLNFFNTETYTATSLVARFLGSAMLLAGMFIWVAKDLTDVGTVRTMTIMLLVSSLVSFILTLVGMVGVDVIRANGWIPLVVQILFVFGYGYLVSGVTITATVQPKKK
ncbi:MAG: hypothetical protein U0V18_03685 [Anaerolineales bacterium]|nr:hypothetical protein [Anaerolineales bacterium]